MMQPFNDYKFLRNVVSFTDDEDYAAGQTIPVDMVDLERPGAPGGNDSVRIKIEFVVEFLDNAGALVTGGRGTFDAQAIRLTTRRSPLDGHLVVDTAVLQSQIAYRPFVVDDILVGDRFGVRLTSIVEPTNAVTARVLYREIT